MIKIRKFQKEDQDEVFRIWYTGIIEDSPELFFAYYLSLKRLKCVLFSIGCSWEYDHEFENNLLDFENLGGCVPKTIVAEKVIKTS